ncbi:serine acetyltransferase 1, chloroplastic-like [Arachis stenosperma]|uniref:serine acetyltransferase 1, chloroplastic-like n=1 Tax=Arachis stenosperma TaxID=217475 RepID=UPI0025AD04B2|nr:serine acetyltransferase 1, chloroplastic-like [Arachis stenosperma]
MRNNRIDALFINRRLIRNQVRIKLAIRDFYKVLYHQEKSPMVGFRDGMVKMISEEDALALERLPTSEEVREAVCDCESSKAPSNDGYNMNFIKKCWDKIGAEFTTAVLGFFQSSRLPADANVTWVALAPKFTGVKEINDLCSISMVGCVYKVILKMLVRRMQAVMPGLVGETQIDQIEEEASNNNKVKTLQTTPTFVEEVQENEAVDLWPKMKEEAELDVNEEPILNSYYQSSILSHDSLESALANYLANRLSSASLPSNTLFDLFVGILKSDQEIMDSVKDDLKAVKERNPACISHVHCFLNFKGFLACQSHRVAHKLWLQGRKVLAVMIQNRVSEVFAVGIYPGAKIGSGILLDHVTGLVVGETAVIGNNVSILHSVTLGETGKAYGDRHPKIGDGVLIGVGTCILGNTKVGECAKIGAGSVVIKDVPPRTTVVSDFIMLLF